MVFIDLKPSLARGIALAIMLASREMRLNGVVDRDASL
jgi:hypothetical protein